MLLWYLRNKDIFNVFIGGSGLVFYYSKYFVCKELSYIFFVTIYEFNLFWVNFFFFMDFGFYVVKSEIYDLTLIFFG